MKKQILIVTCLACIGTMAFGGGIVTNANQSAYYTRTLSRDASTGIDAVYFNPAGLTKLSDGFHVSLNSQSIFQSKDVTNDYMYLSPTPKKYLGDINVPVFPGLYAVWKKGKVALSFGFNPIGGGGGATYEKGLPAFELSPADMAPSLAKYGATDYRLNVYFKGSSMYLGYQLGITYQINDMFSVFAGARYVSVKNTYEGYLKNVEVKMGPNWVEVSDVYAGLATQATNASAGATNLSNTMQAIITGSGGALTNATLLQAQLAGAITNTQRLQIKGGLVQLGIDTTLFVGQLHNVTSDTAVYYSGQATVASQTSALTEMLFNQSADVVQKGWGITPIIGVNIALNDNLNIGIKYEFKTRIDVENETKSDFIVGMNGSTPITMFPDGEKVHSDMPAMLSVGVNYNTVSRISAAAGFHYYWDKGVNYGKTIDHVNVDNADIIDKNYYELSLGLEYGLTKKFYVSGGYLLAKTGVSKDYQSDMSFSLTSNTIGGGLGYKLLNDKLMVNLGVSYSIYKEGTKTYDHNFKTSPITSIPISCTDTYYKSTLILGIGLDYSF
jgi:long-chain fatty acid transport protein